MNRKNTKRKTKAEKQKTGTYKRTKDKDAVLFSLKEIPDPYGYLTDRGREYYFTIAKWCKEKNILTEIDNFELSRLANAYDMFYYHAEKVNEDEFRGITYYGGNKGSNINGHITAMEKFNRVIDTVSKKFGLDQESREKLLAFRNKKDDKENKFKEL